MGNQPVGDRGDSVSPAHTSFSAESTSDSDTVQGFNNPDSLPPPDGTDGTTTSSVFSARPTVIPSNSAKDSSVKDSEQNSKSGTKSCSTQRQLRNLQNELSDVQADIDQYRKRDKDSSQLKRQRTALQDKIEDCEKRIEKQEQIEEKCESSYDSFKQVKKDYTSTCSRFARGKNCEETLLACVSCPQKSIESLSYDCAHTHQISKCPELSGEDLKKSRERKEEHEESLKEGQEEVVELSGELAEKENDLHRELAEMEEEFSSLMADMKRDTHNAKMELEEGLIATQAEIDAGFAKQVQAVQAEIDKSLSIAHEFENAVTKASMAYQAQVQKIHEDCLKEAEGQLARYRKRRRESIHSGGYKLSLSSLTSSTRMPFAKQDEIWFGKAKKRCVRNKKQRFQTARKQYLFTLRQIEQKKEEYQQNLQKLQQRIQTLNQSVTKAKNDILSQYTKKMSSIITAFEQGYQQAVSSYNKAKQVLLFTKTKEINQLKALLGQKQQKLKDKQMALLREQNLINILEARGTSSEEGDQQDLFSESLSHLVNYQEQLEETLANCACNSKDKEDSSEAHSYCPRLKKLQKSQEVEDIERVRENTGRRRKGNR